MMKEKFMLFRNNTRDLMRNHRRRIREGIESPYKNIKTRIGRTVSVAVISDDEWFECPLEWGTVGFVAVENNTSRYNYLTHYADETVNYFSFADDDDDDKWHYDNIIKYIKKKYKAKKVYAVEDFGRSGTARYSISEYKDDGNPVYGFTWSNDFDENGLEQFWDKEMTSWVNGTDMYYVQVLTNVSELDLLDNGEPVDGKEKEACGGLYYDGTDVKELIDYASSEIDKCDYYYVKEGYFAGLYDKNGKSVDTN